tara:strand:- start:20 stop:370 length:351 start_codon:yes stop_codon:yes gene_type:complete
MERVAGIEPAQPAWKAGVLPLNYTRLIFSALTSVLSSRTSIGGGGWIRTTEACRQIYSLIPLATREPLPQEPERADFPGSFTQERHFMGIEVLVQSFRRDFLLVFSRVLLEKNQAL